MKSIGHYITGNDETFILYRDEQGAEYIERANSLSTNLYRLQQPAQEVFRQAREVGYEVMEVPA